MSKLEQAIIQWENSLLDLGKRNRMINYPVTPSRRGAQTLRLDEPGYAELYDLLVRQGKALTVQQPPVEKFDLRCESVMRLFERLGHPIAPMQGDVRPAGSFTEYRKVLGSMRAKMKLAREEQGAGILYLAVGFLDWTQLSGKQEHLCSPLLLVPVRLRMNSIRAPFVLDMLDEDVVVNPALDQLFRMEYGLSLPELADPDAPVDEYLDQAEALARAHNWRVRREAHLALMSFQKISMYHDLKRNHERIHQSAVLRAIAGDEAYGMDASVMDGVSLDAISPQDCHLVVNADSSQHYAVELSRRGVSFCLQGPPGGGKSQTITNIIAQALADGKKVLFVAEKMAALDVVHRRLKDAGLGEFTLALHSHRADRKAILNEISQPLSLKRQELDHAAMTTLDELEELRRSLNIYPVLLHRRREPLGESLYTALGELAQLQELPLVMAPLTGVEAVSRAALTQELTRLTRLADAYRRFQALPDNPWQGLTGMWTTFMARTQLQGEARDLLAGAQKLLPAAARLEEGGYLNEDASLAALGALTRVCAAVQEAGAVPLAWLENHRQICTLARQGQEAALRAAAAEKRSTLLHPGTMTDPAGYSQRIAALIGDLAPILAGLRWQGDCDAFAAHYTALVPSAQRLHDSALAALSLMNCTIATGREADWAFEAAAALGRCAHLPDALPEMADLSPLAAQLPAIRQEAERLTARARELLSQWKPEALALPAAQLFRRFHEDYSGFSRLRNLSRYTQDMRYLAGLYTGRAKLDDVIASSFLNRLSSWQEEKRLWEKQARTFLRPLDLAMPAHDGPWAAVEEHLEALMAISRCADTPAHHRLLTEALARPDAAERARRITEPLRFAMLDRSLRSADYAGDAMADEIGHTLSSIVTAADDLTALRSLTDQLRPLCQPGAGVGDIAAALAAEEELQCSRRAMDEAAAALLPLTGQPVNAGWDALLRRAQAVSEALEQRPLLPDALVPALLAGSRPLPDLSGTEGLHDVLALGDGFAARFAPGTSPLDSSLRAMCARLESCLHQPDALDLWQEWRDALAGMEGSLFAPFVPAAQRSGVATEKWADAARRLFLYTWVENVLSEEHLLSLFRAHVHEARISRFAELDQQQLDIARARIRKQLTDLVPDEKHRALSASDELAILQRELMKKRGHLPLRKLFAKIPTLLTTLKPCLMMSPLSVASFLESEGTMFDLVIFDEASQIMPENAIGAILRGRQIIVTGDTKQMPPTDFFTVSVGSHDYDSEEETEEESAPEESILEQCACVLPSCPLLWHYRSRHESLIAFSNREIYSGRLITFPGSIDREEHLGVEMVYVPDGVFSRRRNLPEARRCVELIEDHILNRSERSLGVVAFSRTQQSAIEDALHRFRLAHPEYEEFFDENRDEPFFIKNLENVQGDERDTMIFSVGYAKTPDGKPMSLNLGPLSASGGERRLNVAITRARFNVKLVTSVKAADIDLGRTQAEGTRLLRAYIDYAEKGFAAIAEDDAAPAAPLNRDAFCAHLTAVLAEAGYPVERDVGCSECRVDVAVRHPQDDSRYVLGVLTDGDGYAAHRTCRDRDRLRGSVLEGMGWRLHRVWAADWLQRPDQVERELLSAVEEALAAPAQEPGSPLALPSRVWSRPADLRTEDVPPDFAEYQQAALPADAGLPINELALRVIETEQPVHIDELCRRLAPALGSERVTPAVRKDVEVAVARLCMDDVRNADGFLSLAGFALAHPRRAGNRPIDMIAPEELQLAVLVVAEHSIGAAREDVLIRAASLMGFERRGPRIQRALENAMDFLTALGRLRIADGKVETVQEATALIPAPVNADETEVTSRD